MKLDLNSTSYHNNVTLPSGVYQRIPDNLLSDDVKFLIYVIYSVPREAKLYMQFNQDYMFIFIEGIKKDDRIDIPY